MFTFQQGYKPIPKIGSFLQVFSVKIDSPDSTLPKLQVSEYAEPPVSKVLPNKSV